MTEPAIAPARNGRPRLARGVGLVVASAVIVLLPLCQLMRPGLSPRVADYTNAAWWAAYAGRFLVRHGALPVSYNTDRFAGHALPLFYGPLLQPLLGTASVGVGPGGAILAAAVAAWAAQYALVFRLVRVVAGCRFRAAAAGALACWAVYPLTNLYSRGAVAEFFGTAFLLCAACAGGLAVLEPAPRRRAAAGCGCGLFGGLAAGSHGITAVVGGIILACLAAPALRLGGNRNGSGIAAPPAEAYRRRLWITAALGLAVAVVVSPWLYVTLRFGRRLWIAGMVPALIYIRENDAWWARLAPVPFDNANVFVEQTRSRGTPYLDAQLGVSTLLLVSWTLLFVWRGRPREADPAARDRAARFAPLLRLSLLLFVPLLVVSVVPPLGWRLPGVLASLVQYAYRLVTYQNLTLFTALVAALGLRGDLSRYSPAWRRADAAAWALALGLAGAALAGKLAHAAAGLAPAAAEAEWAADPDSLTKLPPTFYATVEYAVVEEGRELFTVPPAELQTVHRVFLPVGTGDHFGEPGTLEWEEPRDAWVVTDVVAFPWSRLVLDGQLLPRERTRDSSNLLAVRVTAGRHTLGTRFEPDGVWFALRAVSRVILGAWVVVGGFLLLRACRLPAR